MLRVFEIVFLFLSVLLCSEKYTAMKRHLSDSEPELLDGLNEDYDECSRYGIVLGAAKCY